MIHYDKLWKEVIIVHLQTTRQVERVRQRLRWRWWRAGLIPGGRQQLQQQQQQQLTDCLTGMPVLGFQIRPVEHREWRALVERLLAEAIAQTQTPDHEPRIYVGLQYLDDDTDDRATMWVADRAAWWATETQVVLQRLAETPEAMMQLTVCAHVAVTARVVEQLTATT